MGRSNEKRSVVRYRPAAASGLPAKALVVNHGEPEQRTLTFYDRVEIGRDPGQPDVPKGRILIGDSAVSRHHCTITQKPGGRCFVRDTSSNGTRIEGRRLVPNVQTEILPGQRLTVALNTDLVFIEVEDAHPSKGDELFAAGATVKVIMEPVTVTVLVGDIHSYTRLVQEAPRKQLQDSVARVFNVLERQIRHHGGILKEYQGDAILSYWESGPSPDHALDACRTAIELSRLISLLASDPKIWDVPGFPLGLDWSLATGEVVIETVGGDRPTGLSMIGEPVVLAYRLEKLASAETGNIVVAESTWREAKDHFEFIDRGKARVAGFEEPQHYFSLAQE